MRNRPIDDNNNEWYPVCSRFVCPIIAHWETLSTLKANTYVPKIDCVACNNISAPLLEQKHCYFSALRFSSEWTESWNESFTALGCFGPKPPSIHICVSNLLSFNPHSFQCPCNFPITTSLKWVRRSKRVSLPNKMQLNGANNAR